MDKKGDWTADTAPFMVIFIIVCGMLFLFFIFIVQKTSAGTHELHPDREIYILQERFLTNCFGQEDFLSGQKEFILDWNNFDQKHLDSCYDIAPDSSYYGFQLILKVAGQEKNLTTKNWKGRFKKGVTKNVFVFHDNQIKEGKLLIGVQDVR